MLTILFGFLGLTADVGYLYWLKRNMQTASDAAASSGAFELKRENYGLVTQAALEDMEQNGFDSSNSTVVVNRPPTEGSFAGDSDFVEVTISRTQPSFFMSVLGIYSTPVTVRSVAGLVPDKSYHQKVCK